MKPTFTFLLFIVTISVTAQKMLVPYRSGNLFGLSDENGRIIVTPQYDYVQWMQAGWFRTGKTIDVKDTLETTPGKFVIRNTKAKLSGLINNGDIILQDEPFSAYEIVAKKCIVAEFESRVENLTKEQYKKYGNQRKLHSLFNLKGENLYPENFRRIQKVDTAGVSSRDKKTGRYILFVATHFDNSYSMFVFDADQQKISDWLVKDAFKIEGNRNRISETQIAFTITDKHAERSTQVLDYSSGKFILTSNTKPVPPKKELIEKVEMVEVGPGDHDLVAVPPPPSDESKTGRVVPKFSPYHILIKDTLFYRTGHQEKQPVQLPAGGKIILTGPKGVTQYQPVIVKADNRFYIVQEDKLSNAAYDSLIYFGKYFLAWQKINGQTKAGVINADGSIVIPMEYDSLYADIKYFNLEDMNPAGKSDYKIVLSEADSKYDYSKPYPYKRSLSNFLTVFKNGRCGVISIKGDIAIPVQYELIAKNNLQHSKPREDEFIILKQHNKYGLATFKYNNEKKRLELSVIVTPTYNYIPGFFYPGYYGVKDYKLIGLYDEQMNFKGYASETGKLFYQD